MKLPTAGRCLVATPLMLDPNFYQTVVLLGSHDGEGTFGLVLNRPSLITLGDGLGTHCPPALADTRLHAGGPVEPQSFFTIHNNTAHFKTAEELIPGVWLGSESEVLDLYAFDTPPQSLSVRCFTGYAGWGAGQLDQEIADGSWIVAQATAPQIFSDPQDLWPQLMGPTPTFGALN